MVQLLRQTGYDRSLTSIKRVLNRDGIPEFNSTRLQWSSGDFAPAGSIDRGPRPQRLAGERETLKLEPLALRRPNESPCFPFFL